MVKLRRLLFILGLVSLSLTGTTLRAQGIQARSSQPGQTALRRNNLSAGIYDITFRLRIDKKESSVSPLATLTVSAGRYKNIIFRVITPINFLAANIPEDFRFHFDNFRTQDIRVAVTLSRNKHSLTRLTIARISIAPSRKVSVGTVWPGKILYYPNEEAQGFVTVYNGTARRQKVKLSCSLESELTRVRRLKEENLSLAPFARREVRVSWNTGKEEYGFSLVGRLFDARGKEISQGKEYFSVADDLWKVGITQAGRGSQAPNGPSANDSVPVSKVKKWEAQLAAELAKPFAPVYWNYTNYNEFYAWSPDDFFDLAPAKDYWYSGTGNYTVGKRDLQMAIAWLHRRGMRAIAYVNPFSQGFGGDQVYRRHPEWFVYHQNGQLAIGSYYQKKLEAGRQVGGERPRLLSLSPYALVLYPNIATLKVVDAQVAQIVKSQKMFGWDGIRFDNFVYRAFGYDFYDKKIAGNTKEKGELEARAWVHMRDSLWKKLGPDFAIGDNFDYQFRDRHPAAWPETCRKGQLLMQEVARDSWRPQSATNSWRDFVDYYHKTADIIRTLGGHPLIIGFDKQYPVDQLYLNIFTYAGGMHPCAYQYNSDKLPFGNYARFATRYSYLIWDIARVKPLADPGKIIRIDSPRPVWWKDYAAVRQARDGKRQYIIQLINPPVQERIYTDPTNKVPRPQTNISVSLKLSRGEKISRAYLLSTEPVMHRELLPLIRQGNRVTVKLPKLYFWSILVLE